MFYGQSIAFLLQPNVLQKLNHLWKNARVGVFFLYDQKRGNDLILFGFFSWSMLFVLLFLLRVLENL